MATSGEIPTIVGPPYTVTLKALESLPATRTLTDTLTSCPGAPPTSGTCTLRRLPSPSRTAAGALPKRTSLAAGSLAKGPPAMVTVWPTLARAGSTPVIFAPPPMNRRARKPSRPRATTPAPARATVRPVPEGLALAFADGVRARAGAGAPSSAGGRRAGRGRATGASAAGSGGLTAITAGGAGGGGAGAGAAGFGGAAPSWRESGWSSVVKLRAAWAAEGWGAGDGLGVGAGNGGRPGPPSS